MSKNLEKLKKYISGSEEYMSSYAKTHMLNNDFTKIDTSLGSGAFIKSNRLRKIKYFFAYFLQILIWRNEMFFNEFIKKYQNICTFQSRIMSYELIIHAIVLKLLNNKKILKDKICVIGDGKANFINGLLDLNYVGNIYSINLPQALTQDYLILRKFEHIDDNLIQIVEKKEDLTNQNKKIFLVPASNKKLLVSQNINLFVNMHSFQEMPLEETHKYVDIISSNYAYLYSLNREEKILYDNTIIKHEDFGFHKGKIIFEEEAKFAKYYYSSKFPFIHSKKAKLISTLIKFN